MCFLGGEVQFGVRGSPSGLLAGGAQLTVGVPGEANGSHGVEHGIGRAELAAGVAPAPGTAQPLPVQQVRAGQVEGSTAVLELVATCWWSLRTAGYCLGKGILASDGR